MSGKNTQKQLSIFWELTSDFDMLILSYVIKF